MSTIDANLSCQFVTGHIEINRLGYDGMRITGPDICEPPSDRDAALATLHLASVMKGLTRSRKPSAACRPWRRHRR
jgi:hypothetical protein